MKLILLAISFLFIPILAGCNNAQDPIVGMWGWPNDEVPWLFHTEGNPALTLRFEEDGTGMSYMHNWPSGNFTWEYYQDGEYHLITHLDPDRIEVYRLINGELTFEVRATGSTPEFTARYRRLDENGAVIE